MKKILQKKTGLFVLLFVVIVVSTSYISINNISAAAPSTTHTFTCYGYVKDTNGNAIQGALVRLSGGDPDVGIYVSTTTSSSGYYYLSVQTSLYITCTLIASKSGYTSQSFSVYSKGTVRKDFTLSPATHYFRVFGFVKDESGNGIGSATVKLFNPSGTIVRTCLTLSSGTYSMTYYTSLYAYFTVQASKTGYETEIKSVYSSGSRQVDFQLSADTHYFRVYGYVEDEEFGTRISGATINLINPSGTTVVTTSSSSTGYYDIVYYTALYDYFTIQASKIGYETETKSVYSSSSRWVDFDLKDYWDVTDPVGVYTSRDSNGDVRMIYSANNNGDMTAYHASSWSYCRAAMSLTEYWTPSTTGTIIIRNDYRMNFNTDGLTVPYCKVSFVTTFYDGIDQVVAQKIIMYSQGPSISPPVNIDDSGYLMCGVTPYIDVTGGLSYRIETYLVIEIYEGDYFSLSTDTGDPAEFYSMFDISYV